MTSPTADGQVWRPFTGDYEKEFYEVRSPETGHVIQHMWPNAGWLHTTDGTDAPVTAAMGMEFRKCTCGHKYGGCLPSPPTSGDPT